MRAGRSRPALTLVSLALVGAAAGCTGSEDEEAPGQPARPVSVELAPEGAPDALSVGVVVSLSSAPGEGEQWSEAAQGAEVAAERFRLGDVDVTVMPEDDRGTAAGAEAAVRTLVEDGVSGIVLATEGDHVEGALQAASDLGVPVLLPYESAAADLPEVAWATGPTDDQAGAALAEAVEASGATRPALVDAGGGQPSGVSTVRGEPFAAGDDPQRLATRLVRAATGDQGIDSVVVSGPAELQAQVVRALQAQTADLPVFLTDDALSPVFAKTLATAGGSLTVPLATAGFDADDVVALESGARGSAVSAYLAAVRTVSSDTATTDFFDDEPFRTVAQAVDVRSHDAVVALVTAAAEAGSSEPADVAEALESLTLDAGDGLAGPDLDLGGATAVADEAVVPLLATTQDPGLRQVADRTAPRLFWFRLPSA